MSAAPLDDTRSHGLAELAQRLDRAFAPRVPSDNPPPPDEHGPIDPEPPPPEEMGDGNELILDPRAPYDIVHLFLNARFTHDARRTLLQHGGEHLAWLKTHYTRLSETEIRRRVYDYLEGALCWYRNRNEKYLGPFNPNRKKVSDVVDALAITNTEDGTEPRWLDHAHEAAFPASEIFPCANGLLHVPTRQLLPHSPAFFSRANTSVVYDPSAMCPAWREFMASIWSDDPDSIATLHEIIGYLLTADTRQQKIFMMVGPPRCGKGTIARVLGGLLGSESVVSRRFDSLDGQFGLQPLIGKRLVVMPDVRVGKQVDHAAIAERLLSISGEDLQTINRKHLEEWTGMLHARFLMLTNELPRIVDASGALPSRFVLLILRKSFLGQENTKLTAELSTEFSGILNLALDGYDRLRERGYFLQPSSAAQAARDLVELSSPILAFVGERCLVRPTCTVLCDTLFEEWCSWCKAQGMEHGTKASFGKKLHAAVAVTVTQPRAHDRVRHYEGIGLIAREGVQNA